MNELIDLFKLIQITRDQVQYGYNMAGIHKHELSDLAQHHYLVTFITWQLCRKIKNAGGTINTERALEIAMIHDLGELMGGDINFYYAKANPEAKKLSREFEHSNQKFLSRIFGDDQKYFQELITEMENHSSDESIVAKIADYSEVIFYKNRIKKLQLTDIEARDSLLSIIQQCKNDTVNLILTNFLNAWDKNLQNNDTLDILKKMGVK